LPEVQQLEEELPGKKTFDRHRSPSIGLVHRQQPAHHPQYVQLAQIHPFESPHSVFFPWNPQNLTVTPFPSYTCWPFFESIETHNGRSETELTTPQRM
jgi:hypothetical protein